ncbi:nickel pincer cofactor biosynthesis protein LarB [bacterium]|nr:nickel pincer cofactor biosynthesis protein LarB [bacterium]RQV97068.1 MAG: nickel pincer cofactor biosynthesis protein LarB [bacterium]
MNKEQIKKLLEDVQSGRLNVEEAFEQLRSLPYRDLGFAKIDTHRAIRKGFPEVIYCENKTVDQVREIFKEMMPHHEIILGMRAGEEAYQAVRKITKKVTYNASARAIVAGKKPEIKTKGTILVISAGTADMPVSEEAALTAEVMGNRVERLIDVGVAGVHRLFNAIDLIQSAHVLVVVAGMEGALPGVVAGLVDKPVIAVPTSVGYGTGFKGISALLTMLNSCAPGLGIVNIDNGFGAGYLASLINQLGGGKK